MTSGLHSHGHQISQPTAHHLESSTVLPTKEKTVHGKEKTFKVYHTIHITQEILFCEIVILSFMSVYEDGNAI